RIVRFRQRNRGEAGDLFRGGGWANEVIVFRRIGRPNEFVTDQEVGPEQALHAGSQPVKKLIVQIDRDFLRVIRQVLRGRLVNIDHEIVAGTEKQAGLKFGKILGWVLIWSEP